MITMHKVLILLTVFVLISSSSVSDPAPDNYSQQSPIDIVLNSRPALIVYSPDQNSVAYLNVTNGTFFTFRSSLTQNKQKTIEVFSLIFELAFDYSGDRLYVVAGTNETSITQVYYFTITNGSIDDSTRTLCTIDTGIKYGRGFNMVVSHHSRIAVSMNEKVYILLLASDKKSATIESNGNYSSNRSITDMQWHQTQAQTLFLGSYYYDTIDDFLRYNCTSKQFIQYNRNGTTGVGVMDGNVILQSTTTFGIYAYTYLDGQLTIFDQIPNYKMVSLSLSEKDRNVFVAWTDQKNIRIYEMVPPVETTQNINRMQSNLKMEQNNLQNRPSFNIIFERNSTFNLTFSGISSDGNQVYFYQGTNKNISRWSRCGDGNYYFGGRCYNCSPSCKTCHKSPIQCTTCPFDFQSYESCISCSAKYTGCLTCQASDCTKCNQTANLLPTPINNKCSCVDFTYPVDNGSECKFCNQSITGCISCSNSVTCQQCDLDKKFVLNNISKLCYCLDTHYLAANNSCQSCESGIKNCTSCTLVGGNILCQACTKKFSLSTDRKSCINCSQVGPGCITCDDVSTCLTCDTDGKFEKNGSKCQCISGFTPFQQICISCSSLFGCATCSDIYTCTKCTADSGFILQNGKCICPTYLTGCLNCSNGQNCSKCDSSNNFQLTAKGLCQCKQSYWLTQSQKCQLCSAKFSYCDECSADGKQCLTCMYPQQKLNQFNTSCVCDEYQFLNLLDVNPSCQLCDLNKKCLYCEGFNKCIECDPSKNYNVLAVNGQCLCQAGYFESNNTCVLCSVKGCATCQSTGACIECHTEKNFSLDPVDGVCTCKSGMILNDLKTQCSYCNQTITGCINCNETSKCLTCDPQQNLMLNSMQTECICLDNYFKKDSQCIKCIALIQYCSVCYELNSNVKCEQCNTGFVFNQTSTSCECPDGHEINSSQQCIKSENKAKQESQGLQVWQIVVASIVLVLFNVAVTYLLILKCKKPSGPNTEQAQLDNNYEKIAEQNDKKEKLIFSNDSLPIISNQ